MDKLRWRLRHVLVRDDARRVSRMSTWRGLAVDVRVVLLGRVLILTRMGWRWIERWERRPEVERFQAAADDLT
jgi:hypothetical protein